MEERHNIWTLWADGLGQLLGASRRGRSLKRTMYGLSDYTKNFTERKKKKKKTGRKYNLPAILQVYQINKVLGILIIEVNKDPLSPVGNA